MVGCAGKRARLTDTQWETARVERREGRHCRREDGMNKQSCFSTSGTRIFHRSHACFLSLIIFVLLTCPLFCLSLRLLVPSSRSSFVLLLVFPLSFPKCPFMSVSNPLNLFPLSDPSTPMHALTPIQTCMQTSALTIRHSSTVRGKT